MVVVVRLQLIIMLLMLRNNCKSHSSFRSSRVHSFLLNYIRMIESISHNMWITIYISIMVSEEATGPILTPIEWEMMDKHRFFSFSVVNSVALRTVLYPLTVIKTRLQVRKCMSSCDHVVLTRRIVWKQVQRLNNPVYSGTFDAFVKIVKNEGFRGLYKGFIINSMQVVSGIGYLLTYETVRHLVSSVGQVSDNRIKGLVGGGCGSLVSQTIITPFDVISQHMMVISGSKSGQGGTSKFSSFANPLLLNKNDIRKLGLSTAIIKELYRNDGIKGFYRGYFASIRYFHYLKTRYNCWCHNILVPTVLMSHHLLSGGVFIPYTQV